MKELKLSLHHIGIATDNIEKTEELLNFFGYVSGEIKKDPLQKVYVKFLKSPNGPLIELVWGGKKSTMTRPYKGLLKKMEHLFIIYVMKQRI